MLKLFSDSIDEYLQPSEIIDFNDSAIVALAERFKCESNSELELIKKTFEYVRDNISHSADINGEMVTCKASDVLKYGEGVCYAKSHLLAALLRKNKIPTGFCYQKLILDDETAPFLILHGLNGVYVESEDKWVRLDARGNKEGVNAQFVVHEEQLAFEARLELGEEDNMVCYSKPDSNVVRTLQLHKLVDDLFENLPTELNTE